MKRLLAIAPLLALLASPAMAQSFDPNAGTGNIVPGPDTIFIPPGPGYSYPQPMPIYFGDELAWPSPHVILVPCCVVGPSPNGHFRPR